MPGALVVVACCEVSGLDNTQTGAVVQHLLFVDTYRVDLVLV